MADDTTIIHFLLEHLTTIWGYLPLIIVILAFYLQILAILLFFWETYLVSRDRAYQFHGEKQIIFLITWLLAKGIQWLFTAFHLSF